MKNESTAKLPSALPRRPLTANPTILFIAIIAIASVFVVCISLPISLKAVKVVDAFTAQAFARIWGVVGLEVLVDGISVSVRMRDTAKNVIIGYGCDGVLAYLILASAILPFPCTKFQKVVGLVAGLLFVFAINQIRLIGLISVLFYLDDASNFAFYHTVVGQVFALIMIFVFWSFWASKIMGNNGPGEIEPPATAAG